MVAMGMMKFAEKVRGARARGTGYATAISRGLLTAQAWEVGMEAELKRQEAIYLMERERERKMVQAQGWERDEDYNENCDWMDGARPAEVRLKVINMVVKKNSKKKADVAKEEYGERLIK